MLHKAALVGVLLLMFISWSGAAAQTGDVGAPSGNPLHVKYVGGSAGDYTIFVNSSKYTVIQSYSWVKDETSRYNLISYSIDDGARVEISRMPRGNFALDIPMESEHTISLQAALQYPISVATDSENLNVIFSPPSTTGDSWFDAGSAVTITVSNADNLPEGTRLEIVSWSIDNSRHLVGEQSSLFATPPIQVTAPHQVKFESSTQYYVKLIAGHGSADGEGWYDAGSMASISVNNDEGFLIPYSFNGWDDKTGTHFDGQSEALLVDSPKTLVAKWTADYSRLTAVIVGPVGAAGALVVIKKLSARAPPKTGPARSPETPRYKSRQQVTVSAPLIAVQTPEATQRDLAIHDEESSNYSREISYYTLQKSIEKLERLRSLGCVSDAKFSKVKDRLDEGLS